jgi:uncharacterized protein (TIGR03083 family)
MTGEQQSTAEPMQLPMAPGDIRLAVIAELDRVAKIVAGLNLEDWKRTSAVQEWTVGDIVAHLNLVMSVYKLVLKAVHSGKGAGPVWKTLGEYSKKFVPRAAPALNSINHAVPHMIERALSPEIVKGQFATGARTLRDALTQIESTDYSRPVYYMGRPWPLWYFLTVVINELAIHGWDMASPLRPGACLDDDARRILPMSYWSGTPYMLRLPEGTAGTVQVTVQDPDHDMWWTIAPASLQQGTGRADHPNVTITGTSGTYVLVLAGRIAVEDAFSSTTLETSGDRALARLFLGSWKLV